MCWNLGSVVCVFHNTPQTDIVRMRQQPESRKSKGGPLDSKDYLWIYRRPQTCLLQLPCYMPRTELGFPVSEG